MAMKHKTILIFIIILSINCYLYLFHLYQIIKKPFNSKNHEPEKCEVPILNPFDKTILQFIEKPDNFSCSFNGPLVDSDLNNLYINEHLLQAYGVKNISKFMCCYQEFERETPDEAEKDTEIMYIDNCKPFFPQAKINAEFVEVFCKYSNITVYHDMHSFVPIKKNRNRFANNKQKLNVLMIGIDSLSNMNFQRQMPNTKKYIDENLNSILMSGYNKVAYNSFPNLLSILTGQTEEEIQETCWETPYTKFDKCPIIWNNYSKAGYLTAFAEDATKIGLFHYHNLNGFQAQPTHYYWRTFSQHAENVMGDGNCLGPRPSHKVVLDYAKKFSLSLKDKPFFGFFWSCTLSHDCVNCPALSDKDYEQFFKDLQTNNVLNNTVVIFLSDHGVKNGAILQTFQGYLEERLPLLYFILPAWFSELYPIAFKNMRHNSNKLTSNFDVYETLIHLLDLEKLTTKYLSNYNYLGKRGISLFSLVPENRSCEMAGIPSHWCTCKRRREINLNNNIVQKVAHFIVSYLNKLLENEKYCASLMLDSINGALELRAESKSNFVFKEYTINLKTKPGDAIFESTVRCNGNCYEEEFYKISGIVSRLNKYGNQSYCISHHFLKMYCYCI